MIIAKDATRGLPGEVRHKSLPHRVVPRIRLQIGEERRGSSRKGVLPKIHAIPKCPGRAEETLRIGKASRLPNEAAGIRVRLPTGLQSEHIAWHPALPKFLPELQHRLCVHVQLRPIPEA